MILARWDIIHRAIRDVRLSLLHFANGEFFQAQFHSQYLFSLAYRPFGSSGFFQDKRRLLELMLSRETCESVPMFVDSWESIRDELQMPASSTMADVWAALPLLDGFNSKQVFPKLSRWFSWNQAADEKMCEWTALKVVLNYHFAGEDLDPDEAYQKRLLEHLAKESNAETNMRHEFGKLKEKLGGGLKLCYHIMSNKLKQMVQIVMICTRPVWSWYSHTIKEVHHAQHQVQKLIGLQHGWMSEEHLQRLAGLPTSLDEELRQLLGKIEFDDTCSKVSELSQRVLKNRVWSLSRAAAPPDCYAGLLSLDDAAQKAWWAEVGNRGVCPVESFVCF